MSNTARALVHVAILTSAGGCLDPTQVTLSLSSDVCARISETAISVGAIGEVEMMSPAATQGGCSGADIGTLAVAPTDDKSAAWALKVVSSVEALVDACQPPEYGPQCIVARRSLRFIEHESLELPIVMRESCLGVLCPEDQTCVDGECRLAACDDPGNCGEDELKPLGGFPWAKILGSAGDDVLFDLDAVPGGDVVVTGSASGALDFGGGALSPVGDTDIFVARLGPDGAHRWSRMFGGSGRDEGLGVAAGPTGRIHLVGGFSGNADLGGKLLQAAGGTDVMVASYGGLGSHSWSVAFGGTGDDAGTGVAGDAAGNVFVAGHFTDAITLGDDALRGTGIEGFIASLDPTGKPRWVRAIGGAGSDSVVDIAVDGAGNVYVVGGFEQQALIGDQTLLSRGGRDVFVARFTSDGALTWVKSFGAKSNDVALTLAVSKAGDRIAVGGIVTGSVAVDEVVIAAKDSDGFAFVFDAAGALVWSAVSGDHSSVESLAFDDDGRLYLGGTFSGTIELGTTSLGAGLGLAVLAAVFDPAGAPLWARAIGATQYGSMRGVAPSFDGSVIIGGYYAAGIAFSGTTYMSQGAADVYLARVRPPEDMP
jgi:hypothetical protein